MSLCLKLANTGCGMFLTDWEEPSEVAMELARVSFN